MEIQLKALNSHFALAFATITSQKDLLIVKLEELDEKLYGLQFSNDLSMNCVRRYRGEITTPVAAKLHIEQCLTIALNTYRDNVAGSVNYLGYVSHRFNSNLINLVESCKSHLNPSLNYTNCVMRAISTVDGYTRDSIIFFKDNTSESRKCSIASLLRDATVCTFDFVYASLMKAGEQLLLIENCSKGHELCPVCEAAQVSTPSQRCPHQITVNLKESDLGNATINNPFIGFENIACAEVNIIKA